MTTTVLITIGVIIGLVVILAIIVKLTSRPHQIAPRHDTPKEKK